MFDVYVFTFYHFRETKLSSVHRIRKSINKNCSKRLRQVVSNLTFVGIVNREKVLIQHETELYLCDIKTFVEELFYQILIFDFGNFDEISLNTHEGINLSELASIYFDSTESEWTDEDGDKNELSRRVQEILVDKRLIMKEYFGLTINENGYITTLPIILRELFINFHSASNLN